ncbi:MAG: flagellar hook-basal body complex protein FliE [bacterium]
MAEIQPVSPELRLEQLLGNDSLMDISPVTGGEANVAAKVNFTGNPFEDFMSKAIEALEGVSEVEVKTNQMIDGYLRGEVELHQVMIAQSKMSIMMQLAVTTINAAVTTFKEITQMQV